MTIEENRLEKRRRAKRRIPHKGSQGSTRHHFNSATSENISEKDFQAQILQLAQLAGWLCYHSYDSRKSIGVGYPDLCMVRENRHGTASLVYLELKKEKGKVTKLQLWWLELLGEVPGVIAKVVKPSDWEAIVELLK